MSSIRLGLTRSKNYQSYKAEAELDPRQAAEKMSFLQVSKLASLMVRKMVGDEFEHGEQRTLEFLYSIYFGVDEAGQLPTYKDSGRS